MIYWGWSTHWLSLDIGSTFFGVVIPVRVLSIVIVENWWYWIGIRETLKMSRKKYVRKDYVVWFNGMLTLTCYSISNPVFIYSPVGNGRRTYQLHLGRGVRPRPTTSVMIKHWKIWWWGSSNVGSLVNMEYPLITICSEINFGPE